MSLISCWAESVERVVLKVLATEGAALYVLKRAEVRFEVTLGAIIGREDSNEAPILTLVSGF